MDGCGVGYLLGGDVRHEDTCFGAIERQLMLVLESSKGRVIENRNKTNPFRIFRQIRKFS